MKSRPFIATSVFLFLSVCRLDACGPWLYEPQDYYMYRVKERCLSCDSAWHTPFDYNRESEENCRLWQRQTTRSASLEEIYVVVYKYTVTDLKHLDTLGAGKRNNFTRWLLKDKEALDFLILAKECERSRAEISSKWYYPSKDDSQCSSLEEVVRRSMSYRRKRFASRYVLQAVRALHALQRYEECISCWDEKESSVPDDVVKRMAAGYVGGAYAHIGEMDKAQELFRKAGDYKSVLRCNGGINDWDKGSEDCFFDTQEARDEVARRVYALQIPEYSSKAPEEKESRAMLELSRYCITAAEASSTVRKDFWFYTAAFLLHMRKEDAEASRILALAERSSGGDILLAESIRVFRIYLDAVLTPYSPAYISRMVKNLSWLDRKIVRNYESVAKETALFGTFHLVNNISFYYWNDMMRKITLGVICPKLVANGQAAPALAFANMADNYLYNLVGGMNEDLARRIEQERAHSNYCNRLFQMMDALPADDLIRFDRILGNKSDADMDYLCSRGYRDRSFFREIIGTKLLREMRYVEAARYFSLVPAAFQSRLGTYKGFCFRFDPFSVVRVETSDRMDYKLRFALAMVGLEREIASQQDPDRKAMAMFRYATGIENSVSTCWALTFYEKSNGFDDPDPEYGQPLLQEARKVLFARAEAFYGKALKTARDRETLANMHLQLKNTRTVRKEYEGTAAYWSLQWGCDNYYDYHLERRDHYDENLWLNN